MEPMRIEAYPLQFIIYPRNQQDLELIRPWCKNFIRVNQYWDKRRKTKVTTPVAAYVFFNQDRSQIRAMRTMLPDFIAYLNLARKVEGKDFIIEEKSLDIQLVENMYPEVKDFIKPRGEQQDLIDFVTKTHNGCFLMTLGTGLGKAELLTNKIRVPGGWKEMGEIQVGDYVIAADGNPTRVTGIYPQGITPIYSVKFKDGREVICSDEHIWRVIKRDRNILKEYDIMTKDLKRYMDDNPSTNNSDRRLYIPLCQPVNDYENTYKIHPYVLGVYLGDGSYSGGITNPEEDIIERVRSLLPPELSLNKYNSTYTDKCSVYGLAYTDKAPINPVTNRPINIFREFLKEKGLKEARSWEKFIPEEYMRGTAEQKLEIVRGLLDTDGHINEHGSIDFSTTSLTLANQFRELIFSLGGICKFKQRQTYFTHKGIKRAGRVSYRLNLRFKKPSLLFTTKKKLARCKDDGQYCKYLKLQIVSVEPIGHNYTKCISIEHPSRLYLTENCIVTHNTLSSIFIGQKLKQRMVCIMRPGYHGEQTEDSISGWIKEFAKSTKVEPHEICTVSGNKELKSIINLALNNELRYKVILISNKTLQFYFKYYEQYSEEEFKDMGFNATPMELGKILGVDTVFVDEVHQDSHFQCKLISYLGVNKMVGATGTIKSSDAFVNKMAAYAYPMINRYQQKNVTPHVQPTAFHFKFDKPYMIRSEGFRGYNHINFEKSILKRKGLTKQYFGMIDNLVFNRFLSRLPIDPEYKCLIVVASIKMARELAAYLKGCYPDLEVNSFVEDDPDSNAFNSTICVSTHQSSGTGLDIPKLAAVFMTVAIGSEQTNIQVQGRLRKLPTEGALHDFVYFVCDDITAHTKYHLDKKNRIFKGKLLPVIDFDSNIVLEV